MSQVQATRRSSWQQVSIAALRRSKARRRLVATRGASLGMISASLGRSFHLNISLGRFNRSLTRSISRCGVLMSWVDFFWKRIRITPPATCHRPGRISFAGPGDSRTSGTASNLLALAEALAARWRELQLHVQLLPARAFDSLAALVRSHKIAHIRAAIMF